jgi:hypothetical protein
VLFYSNDQLFHQQVIEIYLPNEGFHLSALIGLRYILTVPVYLISLFGFNAMLVIKFFQLTALLLIYQRSRHFITSQLIRVRFWQLPFIAGPILVFMALLSLRDVLLACFTLIFVTSTPYTNRILGLGGVFLLRPHLAVALAFGFVVSHFYLKLRLKNLNFYHLTFALVSYVAGTIAYWIGIVIQQGADFETPRTIFTQFKFSQLAANFFGLQFLALNDPSSKIVAASTTTLLLSRLVFFDTILIPVIFLISVFQHPNFLTKQKVLTLQAFFFFYGVVSQTSYNSTRQNIPFLACMGVLAVADIEHFRKIKAKVAPKLLMATR